MASIGRTACTQFNCNPVVRELIAAYTPTEPEIAFVSAQARRPGHRVTLAVYLKCFQRLGYFPAAADGAKYDLYDQNLLAPYHIRYGGYDGIDCHHFQTWARVQRTISALLIAPD